MISITVTDRDGATRIIEAKPDSTLMESLRAKAFDIMAVCGGCCSCATCHVFVDPAWANKLSARSQDEQELVQETLSYHALTSRLSCQIHVTDALSGLSITIAPDE